MVTTDKAAPANLAPDEKIAQVMLYTDNALYWGDVVVKSIIRVSTWLRTNTIPDRIAIHNAKTILTSSGANPKPTSYNELLVAVTQIRAFHLMPPAKDPIDFDATEPNRKMEPVNALVGSFLVKGNLRISTSSSLNKFLEITRENFTALYDAEVTNLLIPSFGPLSIPYILVRQETTVFTTR